MLELNAKLSLTPATITAANLCDRFDDEDLAAIGNYCGAGYDLDEQSRDNWMRRNEAGMDLALQVTEGKSFPWANCSNVAFPLVTVGGMQFHARAYPALVNGPDIVKFQTFGATDPQLLARSERVAAHMSWQRMHEDRGWEESTDKGIFNVSIVGTAFKKCYRRSAIKANVSELVLAKYLCLNYWSKSVEDCPRKTHIIPMQRNEIHENIFRGKYRDVTEEGWYNSDPQPERNKTQAKQDNRQGVTPPGRADDTSAYIMLEQHTYLDLDQDGYAEPYIVTFEKTTRCVVRIVANFEESDIERVAAGPRRGQIIRIQAAQYFVKYSFIPSPDGGIYDIGFGVLLGPNNEAVNSIVNQLIDCGTLQTTAGGFLGRGAKLRGGTRTFSPFEWKNVETSGDDLRKSIFPLPVNQPSDVLFKLLGLLIDYTQRISGTTDITVGENPGQNTPAETSRNMVEMGQKVYTAIYKRLWRSMKGEFTLLYKLNALYMDPDAPPAVGGATKADYVGDGYEVCPVADPAATSEAQRVQQAMILKQAAMQTPGYNRDAVERRFLMALRVENIPEIFQGTEGQPPAKDPKLVIEEVKIAGRLQEAQLAEQGEMQRFLLEMQEEHELNQAKIIELQAKALEASANAQSEQAFAQIGLINAQISKAQVDDARTQARIEHITKVIEMQIRSQLDAKKLQIEEKKVEKANAPAD